MRMYEVRINEKYERMLLGLEKCTLIKWIKVQYVECYLVIEFK